VSLPDRLYESYAATHAGSASPAATRLIYRRDIRPRLPAPPARVLDIGCGQGELVRLLLADGYQARGVDVSAEQVRIARHAGLRQVDEGDLHTYLAGTPASWDAIVATDVLEHLVKPDVLRAFDQVRRALAPGGVFVARVPNAVSPLGGHIRYGDFTHQTSFTRRSMAQLAAVAGFACGRAYPCPPVAHGPASTLRALLWKPIAGLLSLALAVETGSLRGHITTQNLTFVAYRGDGVRSGVPTAPVAAAAGVRS